jgi:hypothetical protein
VWRELLAVLSHWGNERQTSVVECYCLEAGLYLGRLSLLGHRLCSPLEANLLSALGLPLNRQDNGSITPKRRLTSSRLRGFISRKLELLTVTAVIMTGDSACFIIYRT